MNGTFHHFVKEMVDLVTYWVVCGEFFCVNKFRFHSVFRPPLEAPLSTDTASLSKIALYRIFSCQQRHRTADPLLVISLSYIPKVRVIGVQTRTIFGDFPHKFYRMRTR